MSNELLSKNNLIYHKIKFMSSVTDMLTNFFAILLSTASTDFESSISKGLKYFSQVFERKTNVI